MITMRYMSVAETDIGIVRNINQDGILIKYTTYEDKEVLMAIICDGVGGLSKGEIASTTVIREFERWFSTELLYELKNTDMDVIGGKWSLMLKTLNITIKEYGQRLGERLGTTFTGALFVDDKYVIVHVGDTRMYYIGTFLEQLTCDHTYIAREVFRGNLTLEEAKVDKRRNILLQCVGASEKVMPQVICGKVKPGVYMLCSDGFRHKITENEICEYFNIKFLKDKQAMLSQCRRLIQLNKQRKETDNISVILIKAFADYKYRRMKISGIIKRMLHTKKKLIDICK